VAAYYYDSGNTADGSRDGSQTHPFLDPSELPTPSRITDAQSEHYFKRGTTTNLEATLRSTALTNSPIVVGAWGSGDRPIITAYRALDSTECVEVDVDNSGAVATITPQGGTNLWRVPKTFFGLFDGDLWGSACDVTGVDTGTKVMPSADREWCGAVADEDAISGSYGVIYSVGNPVTTYGAVYVSSFSEGTWGTTANERVAVGTLLALGGCEIADIDFRRMYRVTRAHTGSVPSTAYDLALHSIHDCRVSEAYRGFSINIGAANAPNVTHASIRVYDNYGENLGNSLFDTAGTLYSTINDTRIYRNVVNGYGYAYSTGCFYLASGVSTTDGGRILVEENCVFDGDGGNYWSTDGHAYYQEEYGSDVEFRRNVASNCKLSYMANLGAANIVFRDNVGIAPAAIADGLASGFYSFMTINSNDSWGDHHVYIDGNVAVGYVRFLSCNDATAQRIVVKRNISDGGGPAYGSGEGSHDEAIRSGTVDTTKLVIDGNNFYNHDHDLKNYSTGFTYDSAPQVNNRITTDPGTEIARLPVMDDPTVNYALQIRPGARIKAGVVDLRPGTRLVV
jgi:hypothetical protein